MIFSVNESLSSHSGKTKWFSNHSPVHLWSSSSHLEACFWELLLNHFFLCLLTIRAGGRSEQWHRVVCYKVTRLHHFLEISHDQLLKALLKVCQRSLRILEYWENCMYYYQEQKKSEVQLSPSLKVDLILIFLSFSSKTNCFKASF